MWKFVGLQWLTGLVSSIGLFVYVSFAHGVSGVFGLVAVALPTTLFAGRLSMGHRTAVSGVATFLVGEFLKVAASLCIFALAFKLYHPLVVWAMMIVALATLKSYFLAFFLK